MKAKVLRIIWHDKKPVFSVDFDPQDPYHFVTAGGDSTVRTWKLIPPSPSSSDYDEDANTNVDITEWQVQYCSTLRRHLKSVNCARFSHTGESIASAGDGGTVFLWRRANIDGTEVKAHGNRFLEEEEEDDYSSERWVTYKTLRASDGEDIYDLVWSPDDYFLLIGLTDNTAQIWDLNLSKCIRVLRDHSHFVQGVAWDPWDHFLITASADRSVKIWQRTMVSKKKSTSNVSTDTVRPASHETPPSNNVKKSSRKGFSIAPLQKLYRDSEDPSCFKFPALFHDETLVSFFRRPEWSPDGSILLLPSGLHDGQNCLHVMARARLDSMPIACLRGFPRAVLGAKFSPRLYPFRHPLRDGSVDVGAIVPLFNLPYRMMYAIWTMDTIYVVDTEEGRILATIQDLHYGSITDVAWLSDGLSLIVTATDGFCSLISLNSLEWEGPLARDIETACFEETRRECIACFGNNNSCSNNSMKWLESGETMTTTLPGSMGDASQIASSPIPHPLSLSDGQLLSVVVPMEIDNPLPQPSTTSTSTATTTTPSSLPIEDHSKKRRIQPVLILPS